MRSSLSATSSVIVGSNLTVITKVQENIDVTVNAFAKCKLQNVVHFLLAEEFSTAEIHWRKNKVCGENYMGDDIV